MDKITEYLNNILNDNDTIVVAVSGGPDSMALIDILIKIDKKLKIICAHVNHNTGRIGQTEEELYVKEYCKQNNIIFELLKIKDYSDDNFENEARTKRYQFFDDLMKKYNSKYLFTAHHGDDLIETIIMRIVRGSTLKGYAGFAKEVSRENYTIIRPLIELTKEEIIKYNEKNKIKYFTDCTNLEDFHTRNRYRKYILPKLKEEEKNVNLKFYKFSRMLFEYSEYIDKQVLEIKKDLYKNNILDINKYMKLDKLIQIKIIHSILEEKYEDDLFLINDKHVNNIIELIYSKNKNSEIHLPNNVKIIKKYNQLEITSEISDKEDYEIEIINFVKLPNNHKIEVINSSDKDDNFICRLDKNEVSFPIYVRNRKNGDKMFVKNMKGRKKINDIFIDSKIDMNKRDKWPVVLDSNNNIVWLPGLKKSKFDKTKDEKYDIILKYY